MIAAVVWGLAAGVLARAVVGPDKPGLFVTLISGLAGYVVGFLLTHELFGLHAIHLFAPEGLLPASAMVAGLMLARSRLRRAMRHKTTFG